MIAVLLLGFAVGVILALTGAGGGILAVPFLVFGVGLSMAEAGPIGLLAVGLAATLGAVMGLRKGIVRYKAALVTAGAGVICSPLGLWLAQRTPNRPLTILFALLLMYVAFRALQKSLPSSVRKKASETRKPPPCVLDENRGKLNWTGPCAWALTASGIVAGVLSGLLGVGGGFVMVPALQRYTNLTTQSVLATSLTVIALVSMSGVLASSAMGHLQWPIALPFSMGAIVGMLGGRLVAARLPEPYLQRGFALVSTLVAVALLVKTLG
ncbi:MULTISPECIES: sulfite exporter TauE/SafE family protein [unclassified Pseudomonas]|uniref:sulfite exporter TauE/SafE family protein n=1 Tax=unclassified Pseudomonas TaxID=196821 RepID=UPI0030D6DBE4